MKNLRIFMLLFFISLSPLTKGQDMFAPPTLGGGLNSLTFTKGILDTEVLSSVIDQKRKQVKNEAIRRLMLRSIQNGSFTFYDYTESSLNVLFQGNEEQFMTKEVYERTVNMAFVYGFTNYYLEYLVINDKAFYLIDELDTLGLLYKNPRVDKLQIKKNIDNIKRTLDDPNSYRKISILEQIKELEVITNADSEKVEKIQLNALLLDMVYDICKNNSKLRDMSFFTTPINYRLYEQMNKYVTLDEYSNLHLYLQPIYEDMEDMLNFVLINYEFIREMEARNDETVDNIIEKYKKELKYIENNSYVFELDSYFERQNTVLFTELDKKRNYKTLSALSLEVKTDTLYSKDSILTILNKALANTDAKEKAEILESVERSVKALHLNINRYISNSQKVFEEYKANPNAKINVSKEIKTKFSKVKIYINDLQSKIDAVIVDKQLGEAYFVLKKRMTDIHIYYLEPDQRAIITDIYRFLGLSKMEVSKNNLNLFVLKRIEADLLPRVQTLAASHQSFKDIQNYIERIYVYGTIKQLGMLRDRKGRNMNIHHGFINFVIRLSQLDQAKTYECVLENVSGLGFVIGESGGAKVVNSLINAIIRYTQIDGKSNFLRLDSEGILAALYEAYANQTDRMIDIYFSLGLNQSLSNVKSSEEDSTGVNMVGFAAEKIGIKLKIFNWKKYANYSYEEFRDSKTLLPFYNKNAIRPYNPLVSDMHLLVYGSGLLYNLSKYGKTNENFSYPLFGVAGGISFFNGLDLHVFYNIPILPNQNVDFMLSQPMIGISFDIKIGDYLSALAKKKKHAEPPAN